MAPTADVERDGPEPAILYTTAPSACDCPGTEPWEEFHGALAHGTPVRCLYVTAEWVEEQALRYRAAAGGHLVCTDAEWRLLCERGVAHEGRGADALRALMAGIPVERRCDAKCATWIVSETGVRGLEIQACDDCWSEHGVPRKDKPADAELLALPEARAKLTRERKRWEEP